MLSKSDLVQTVVSYVGQTTLGHRTYYENKQVAYVYGTGRQSSSYDDWSQHDPEKRTTELLFSNQLEANNAIERIRFPTVVRCEPLHLITSAIIRAASLERYSRLDCCVTEALQFFTLRVEKRGKSIFIHHGVSTEKCQVSGEFLLG